MQNQHKFILLSDKPRIGMISESSFLVTNYYLKDHKMSRNKWKKHKGQYVIHSTKPNGDKYTSKNINYLILSSFIRKNLKFHHSYFNLPIMECFWLDHSLEIKMDNHITDKTGTLGLLDGVPEQQYGKDYPIKPNIKREGIIYTTFQPQLIRRIINKRISLIENSHLALTDDWVFDLRAIINDTISLLEITLNQFYIKAEFDPLSKWVFDKEKLGEKHGQRLKDKFNWIYKITGNNLNIESERDSLSSLKNLRNHLMHFDPPSLVITIEEATIWLNQIIDIGLILIKIRRAINVEISFDLVNFILQGEAVFNPKPTTRKRKPLSETPESDYLSSTWKNGSS